MVKWAIPLLLGVWSMSGSAGASGRDYRFDGSISRPVLESYLSRAVTINGLSYSPCFDDDVRMLKRIEAKFLGRVAYIWGGPAADEAPYWRHVKAVADKLHAADPEWILQACVFETAYESVSRLPIPAWVFEEFGLPVEQRTFRYDAMLHEGGRWRDLWGPGGSVPDISKQETKLWFFYRAKSYIDAGYEAIHWGQMGLSGAADPDYRHWKDVLDRVRRCAATHARRHYVLFDAHVVATGRPPVVEGKLLLDSFGFPLRPKEVPGKPEKAVLEMGHADTIFGRSPGGIHPSGWTCEHCPYLVEFDQCGPSGKEGQPGAGVPFVWGWEEATWLAHQPEAYRNDWLRYAARWVREHDPNGYLQMPGSIPMAVEVAGTRWYRANTRSEQCPQGFSQQETIREIWSGR
jgi:hypothetical protein